MGSINLRLILRTVMTDRTHTHTRTNSF